MKQYPTDWQKSVRVAMKTSAADMVEYARTHHSYKDSMSGNATKSIDFEFDNSSLSFAFGLVKKITDAKWKKKSGVQYTTFLHEGTYNGYKKSKASKGSYSHTTPKTGHGIEADHYIVRAWDKYYPSMKSNIKNALREILAK